MSQQSEAVGRMREYIDSHLNETVTMADLARVSLFSPWHSYRLFKRVSGITPAEYIRRTRLSRSAIRLRDEHARVADVAFDMGYSSVDGYQRAFFREFGFNPSEYASTDKRVELFSPRAITDGTKGESGNMESKFMFVTAVRKPAHRVIIKRGIKAEEYMEYCEEVGCDIWDALVAMPSLCGEPVCLWLPDEYVKKGTSKYVQGVEAALDGDIDVPEGFDVITLPDAEYLQFQGAPFAEEDYAQAIGEVWEAMKQYNPAVNGYEWDDSQPRIQLAPLHERGYIELRAVRKKA